MEKICKNCENSTMGYAESSQWYGLMCDERECSVDESDSCSMFEPSVYIKLKEAKNQILDYEKALNHYANRMGDGGTARRALDKHNAR